MSTRKWEKCRECNGLWLTGETVRKLVGRQHHKNITLHRKRAGKQTSKTCPKDQHPLLEITMKGVAIDCCTKCDGVWFDEGELKLLKKRVTDPPKGNPNKGSSLNGGDILGLLLEGLLAGL